MANKIIPKNWLQSYLIRAVRKNLCTKVYCTTCGAREFRRGVRDALTRATGQKRIQFNEFDQASAIEIGKALAAVQQIDGDSWRLEGAVKFLLCDLQDCLSFDEFNETKAILVDSWAGNILNKMQEHYEKVKIKRFVREEYESPSNVLRRREEKRRLKQEQHQRRLTLKEKCDCIYHEKKGLLTEPALIEEIKKFKREHYNS